MSPLHRPLAALLAALPLAAHAGTPAWSAPTITASGTTSPQDAATIAALNERLRRLEQRLGTPPDANPGADPNAAATGEDTLAALDQRLLVLERKLELQQEDATAKAATTPVVAVNEKGLSVKSPNGDYEIKLRGVVQADQRTFADDEAVPQNDTFLFRRIRPTLEGSLGPLLGFRLTPEFAGDSATIVDAYVDVKFNPAYTLRVGKLKGPIGLERLQSASAISFIERGYPTELAPNRDLGVQLQGELGGGRTTYALGAFNGAPDGRDAPTTDADNNLEFAGRVFFEPWTEQRERAGPDWASASLAASVTRKAPVTTSCRAIARRARRNSSTTGPPSSPMARTRAFHRRRITTAMRSALLGEIHQLGTGSADRRHRGHAHRPAQQRPGS